LVTARIEVIDRAEKMRACVGETVPGKKRGESRLVSLSCRNESSDIDGKANHSVNCLIAALLVLFELSKFAWGSSSFERWMSHEKYFAFLCPFWLMGMGGHPGLRRAVSEIGLHLLDER
jgi:hypothetical protein